MERTTKRIAAVGLPLAAIAITGIAFAAWTSSGSGTGSAVSRTPAAVTFSTAAGSVVNNLYPTGSGDIALSANNSNNPYKVALSTFVLNAAYDSASYTDATTHGPDLKTTCALTINQPGTPPTVNGGATSTVVLTNGISMGNAATNACAGLTFVLDISATATSAT